MTFHGRRVKDIIEHAEAIVAGEEYDPTILVECVYGKACEELTDVLVKFMDGNGDGMWWGMYGTYRKAAHDIIEALPEGWAKP